MVQPNDVLEQTDQDHFIPDEIIAVYFGISKYGNTDVNHITIKSLDEIIDAQKYSDHPQAQADCELMKKSLYQFGVVGKDAHVFDLYDNPKEKDYKAVEEQIKKLLVEGKEQKPMKTYMVIWFFAGQGIIDKGQFCVIFNELDINGKIHKQLDAEHRIKDYAMNFPNTYHLCMFACTSHQMNDEQTKMHYENVVHNQKLSIIEDQKQSQQFLDQDQEDPTLKKKISSRRRVPTFEISQNRLIFGNIKSVEQMNKSTIEFGHQGSIDKNQSVENNVFVPGDKEMGSDFSAEQPEFGIEFVDSPTKQDSKEEEEDDFLQKLQLGQRSQNRMSVSIHGSCVAKRLRRKIVFEEMGGFRMIPNIQELYVYAESNKIGQGAFGEVYEAIGKGGEVCAVKVQNKEKLKEKNKARGLDNARREISVLENISHPNIVQVVDLCEDNENFYIVMELVAHGTLQTVIEDRQNNENPLTEIEVINILKQILEALNYLHKSDMVHRDLKPDNILIERERNDDDSEDITCKVADFGLAFIDKQGVVNKEQCGTTNFMAPEVIKGEQNEHGQNSALDIWSLGVLAFILLTSKVPFRGKDKFKKYENIKNSSLDFERTGIKESIEALEEEGNLAKDFLTLCMKKEAYNRPTAERLMSHPWIQLGETDTQIDDFQRLNAGIEMATAQRSTDLQTCVISYLIGIKSNKDELKVLREVFKSMDKNNDGYLSAEEIEESMNNNKTELKCILGKVPNWNMLVKDMKPNRPGLINWKEFLDVASNRLNYLVVDENLKLAFDHLDKNGDGRIDASELSAALTKIKTSDDESAIYKGELSEDYWNSTFAEIDKDKNGYIDYKEFRAHMLEMVNEKLKTAQKAQGNMEELQIQVADDDNMPTTETEYLNVGPEDDYVVNYSVDTKQRTNYVFLFLDAINQDNQDSNDDAQISDTGENNFVKDVIELLKREFDANTLSVTIPYVFKSLTARFNYSMFSSEFKQPLRLNFESKIVSFACALIFVNERIDSQYQHYTKEQKQQIHNKYKTEEMPSLNQLNGKKVKVSSTKFNQSVTFQDAKKFGEDAHKLCDQVLKFNTFDTIEYHLNLNKDAIIKQLEKLKKFAQDFKDKNKGQHCAISIFWIGNSINSEYESHQKLLEDLQSTHNYEPPKTCIDGTDHPQKYALTVNGQPLCIQEYADWIAATSETTHVITYDPIQQNALNELKLYHISHDAQFHERINRENRSGRFRHTAIHSGDISEIYQTMYAKQKSNQNVFRFPFHLTETSAKITDWGEDIELEDIIFDLRDKVAKRLMKQCKPVNTIKAKTEVFEERPQLIYCEQVDDGFNWNPSVHQLLEQNQVMFIGVISTEDEVKYTTFTFWTSQEPYIRYQVINDYETEHYHAATVVKRVHDSEDRRSDKERANKIVVIMFTGPARQDKKPFKFIQFTRENRLQKWISNEIAVKKMFDEETCVRSCYMLKDSIIFVATTRYMVFFNKNLKEIIRLTINKSLTYNGAFNIQHLTSCTPANNYNNKFIYAIKASNKGEHFILKSGLTVKPNVSFEKADSIFKTKATINTVIEYAPGKLIVQTLTEVDEKASILVIEGFRIRRIIHDPNKMNEEKNLLLLLPGLKKDEFPIIMSTGSQTLDLINLNTSRTQVLIDAPIYGVGPQQTVFFQEEDYGFSLVFATRKYDKEGDLEFGWHKMPIKKDMIRFLDEYGQLPFSKPEEGLKELQKHKKIIEQQDKRIRELESKLNRVSSRLGSFGSISEDQFESLLRENNDDSSFFNTQILYGQMTQKENEIRDQLQAKLILPPDDQQQVQGANSQLYKVRSEPAKKSEQKLRRGYKEGLAFRKKIEEQRKQNKNQSKQPTKANAQSKEVSASNIPQQIIFRACELCKAQPAKYKHSATLLEQDDLNTLEDIRDEVTDQEWAEKYQLSSMMIKKIKIVIEKMENKQV